MCIRDRIYTDAVRRWEPLIVTYVGHRDDFTTEMAIRLERLHTTGAVSYTHLDVYKRQRSAR